MRGGVLESDTLTRFQQSMLMGLDVQDVRMAEPQRPWIRPGTGQIKFEHKLQSHTTPCHPCISSTRRKSLCH